MACTETYKENPNHRGSAHQFATAMLSGTPPARNTINSRPYSRIVRRLKLGTNERDESVILLINENVSVRVELVARPSFPYRLSPAWVGSIPRHDMPMKMRTSVAKALVVHVIGGQSIAKSLPSLTQI